MGANLPLWWLWWWPDSSREALPEPEELTLRDGSRAWIRPIRPSDRSLHAESYEELSSASKYRRFLSGVPHMTEEHLARLVDGVDGVDHVAYYLFVEGQQTPYPAATGRIIRDPEHPEVADLGVMVKDGFEGRGLATALVSALVERRPAGVTHLVTVIAADNSTAIQLVTRTGPHQITFLGGGICEVRVTLAGGSAEPDDIAHVPTEHPPAPWRRSLRLQDLDS